jgi:geranylgeranyl pyrophosphate synthase
MAGVGEKCQDYAAVLVNNAAWRETLARIPYARRLLLLPQCLRDRERCQADIDEFGLVCKHCGLCEIHRLQTAAERLGYVVLVAEGTVVVTSLIGTRKIEAIVGVSCLDGLERVFPYMEAGAIPAIAIPLLQNGCANTSVDLDWVWDAIHLTSDDKTRRLDLDALRARVDSWFTPEALNATLGVARTEAERIARAWLAKSGKRWRPFLAVCAFQALQDDPEAPPPEELRQIAVAVECFHKASLVHDDIEDGDSLRYGEKTLHEEHGVPVALNVGDLLLGEGYRMIAECEAPAACKAEMLRAATRGHRTLCVGQGEELSWRCRPEPLSMAKVLDIFRQKTAPAFEVALRLGALSAGADGDLWGALGDYSEALGIAYQIRDDLADLDGEAPLAEASAPPPGPASLSPSVLLAIAQERAEGEARALLDGLWGRPLPAGAVPPELRRVFADLNVEDTARQLLESHKEKAVRSLRSLGNANLKGLLRRVIARIFNELEPKT